MTKGNTQHAITKRAMVVDMLEVAIAIEEILSNANLLRQYPRGIYLNDKAEPALIPTETYYFEKVDPKDSIQHTQAGMINSTVPLPVSFNYVYEQVLELSHVLNQPWDVVKQITEVEKKIFYDNPHCPVEVARELSTFEVMVTHHQLKGATLYPRLPMYGLQLVYDIIEDAVYKDMCYDTGRPKLDAEAIVVKYVADQFKQITPADQDSARKTGEMVYAHDKPEFIALTKEVYQVCRGLLNAVKSYVDNNNGPLAGNEGYGLYELNKLTSTMLSLEYKGDYRIMDWRRRMDEGTWV